MPSIRILEQKQKAVAELTEKLKNSTAGVLVNYTGITVDQDTEMRAALRKAGVEYKVYKNNLTRRACEEAGFGEMKDHLIGMNALAISESDPVAPAKILKEYADKIETFEIKAGFIDGGVVDAATVNALAAIPPMETLIGKMMGSMQSSLYGLAYVLQAKIDKESGEAAAEEA